MAAKRASRGLTGLGDLATLLRQDQKRLLEGQGVEGVFSRMSPAPVAGTILKVPIDDIHPDPDQPRRTASPDSLDELASSIRQVGVREPIHVVQTPEGYRILTGERRWLAARKAGLKSVPVIVEKAMEEGERFLLQLVENIQREDLNPIDRAEALKVLREKLGLRSWEAVGEKLGISRRRVYQLLATTELPEAIQADIRAGVLSEKDSRLYKGLSEEQQLGLHRLYREKGWGQEALREAVAEIKRHPELSLEQVLDQLRGRRGKKGAAGKGSRKSPTGPIEKVVHQSGTLSGSLASALERDLWWQCGYEEQSRLHEALFQLKRDIDRFLLSTQRMRPPARGGAERSAERSPAGAPPANPATGQSKKSPKTQESPTS